MTDGSPLTLDSDVPATRGECVGQPRPCTHVMCRYHLWREDGPDRQGPHWRGDLRSVVRPAWTEDPTPPSCALDVADARPLNDEEIAKAIGKTPDWTRRLIRRALRKLERAAPEAVKELK